MPELPEVEVVRRGLQAHVVGRTIGSVRVLHPRAVRRHLAGGADLSARLEGLRVAAACRRGKYLWLELVDDAAAAQPPDLALVVHLGMSGQMLVQEATASHERHLRIAATLSGPGEAEPAELRFVDQRTFGGWVVADLVVADADAEAGGARVPEPVAHIARDPLDPAFDAAAVVKTFCGKHTEIKRALLDQTVVSGVGNIYADEALWRAKIHGRRRTDALSRPALHRLLDAAATVMREALSQGGTSFDALYVNVNGESGYFSRSLDAYGREGLPCARCGAAIERERFMNRSSFFCPKCQPRPRA